MDDDRGRKRRDSCLLQHKYRHLYSQHLDQLPPHPTTSTSPSLGHIMPGAWPSTTPAKDSLSCYERAVLPAVEEGDEYRGREMMGSNAWDVLPSTLSGNTSNQRSSNPSQGMMPSDLDLLHPDVVPAAEIAAKDANRRTMTASINDDRWRGENKQNSPSSYIPHQDFPNLIPPNSYYYDEPARTTSRSRTIEIRSWDLPSQDVCGTRHDTSRFSTSSRKNPPHPSSSQYSFPSTSTLRHSIQLSSATISRFRTPGGYRTSEHPEPPGTFSPFNEAISLRCSSRSRSFTPQQNNPFFDDSLFEELDSPLDTSVLNTPFIPVDEDPDFHINGCEEGWPNEQESGDDEPFPAEKGDGEDTQQSFHTSFSSYSQQRRDGRPERPNPWHAVSQPSLLRHNMIERKPTMQSTQYFQQYVEPESLVKGYERRRREFLASNPELEENEDLKIEMGWYWTKKRHTKKQEDAGMSSFAATIPEGIFDAPQTGTSAGGEFIPPSFEGAISEASSCTLRNETPETEEESKELIGPIELVEWIPSQKHQQIMAMYCVDSDDEGSGPLSRASTYQPPLTIERSSKEKWEASSHSSLDTDTTTTQQRLKWAQTTLVASPLRKRKFEGSDREQSDFEIDKVEETPPPSSKRSRFSLSSSNMDSIPETPTHSQNRRQYVPSSDIDEDDLSSISSEDTPVRTTERRTWKSKIATPKISASRSNRKVSLNEFRELPLLPERSLSEILMARFGGSITSTSTPERNVPGGVEYSTPSAATSTPKASPSLFSDNEQFQNAFNIAFNSWMSEHGESMVQAAVQAAVEKEMQKMTAARDVDRGIAKETVNERRDEEVVEVQDSQGWTDDDEL